MFDDLSKSLDKAWDMVRKDGKLTKDNIKEPMREIRRALLEADVSKQKSNCLACSLTQPLCMSVACLSAVCPCRCPYLLCASL